jgi:hypothetical protein
VQAYLPVEQPGHTQDEAIAGFEVTGFRMRQAAARATFGGVLPVSTAPISSETAAPYVCQVDNQVVPLPCERQLVSMVSKC